MGHRDPLDDLLKLRSQFNEVFERSFRTSLPGGMAREHWAPPADLIEDGNRIVLLLEIPGMDQEDIQIEFVDRQIIIQGERATPPNEARASVHRVEREHGPFRRVLSLPDAVNVEQLEAHYENGVLSVVIPFLENSPTLAEVN